jgi:hypothetical protein
MALSHMSYGMKRIHSLRRDLSAGALVITVSALSGCTVFGRHIDDGIWFPLLLVGSFILFLVWRVFAVSARGSGNSYRDNASYFDSGADGHAGHGKMHGDGGDDGGDDGGGDSGGHGLH